jgi:hypothetical protein
MSAIISCKNKAENLIINLWEDVPKSYIMVKDNNRYLVVGNNIMVVDLKLTQPKGAITSTKTLKVNLSSQGPFPDKLMHTSELKFTKIKELSIIYKEKNKKT